MTIRDQVAGFVLEALLEAGAAREAIRADATWAQVGADRVEVVRAVESRYGVRTRADEVAGVHTVGQAVDHVLGRVAALSRERALAEAA